MSTSSEVKFQDWFRCPICSDDGKVVLYQISRSGGVEFKCQSREHRLENGTYSYFERETREDARIESGYLYRLLQKTPDEKMKGGLSACIECPHCDSDATDGAVEIASVRPHPRRSGMYRCVLATVWCRDCSSVERNYIWTEGVDVTDEQLASSSEYPPKYIRQYV